MSLTSVETTLAKYHVLHLVIGIIIGAVLLAIPKLIGVCVAVFLVAMLLPSTILPDFAKSKWLDRFCVLAGAIAVGVLFHYLGKI